MKQTSIWVLAFMLVLVLATAGCGSTPPTPERTTSAPDTRGTILPGLERWEKWLDGAVLNKGDVPGGMSGHTHKEVERGFTCRSGYYYSEMQCYPRASGSSGYYLEREFP